MDGSLHSRLLAWWGDDVFDPYRPTLDNPDVQRLAAQIGPGSHVTDLGGTMSLNARLDPADLVLRVHQPFMSRQRLLAVQEVRRRLADLALVVPVPLPWRSSTVFRCGNRWAELEEYLPHAKPAPTPEAYTWLFRAMGALHRALATLDLTAPRPVVATYGPPRSLRRWLPVTDVAVQGDPEAENIVRLLRDLVSRLSGQWVPANRLPVQLVHGDVRLGNVRRTPDGETAYLDFGFLAHRPRVHELAYSLAFMVLALDGCEAPERFAWRLIPRLIEEYEAASKSRLSPAERRALAPYTAAVPLYHAAIAGFTLDPAGHLRDHLPFLRLGEWLLAHPDAILG